MPNRLAPPPQNALLTSVPQPYSPATFVPAPTRFNALREAENLSIGLGSGFRAGLEGTKQLLTQPVATARALVEAARQVGTDPRIVLDMLRAARQKAMSGSLGLGELIGENLTPGVRGKTPNVRKIFVGKGSKTWDAAAAKRAEELEAQGVSPEEIWQQTGTFRSPDGQLRQEISDFRAQWTATKDRGVASEMLEHPELYAAYPDVAQIPVKVVKRETRGGQYQPAIEGTRPESIEIGPKNSQNIAIHELQHAIQEREGFSRGGMPFSTDKSAFTKEMDLLMELNDKMDEFKKLRKALPFEQRLRVGATIGWHRKEFDIDDLIDEIEDKVTDPVIREQMLNIVNELDAKRENAFGFQQGIFEQQDMRQNYMRLAGEAEARAAENRSYMSGETRRAIFPLKSYDVPINQLIVK